jgi:hypothetical protein
MKRIRKIGTALVVAAMLAGGLTLGSARVEAKGKGGGGGANEAICAYLAKIINYPYVNPYIRDFALDLFAKYECDPALIN